jgi:hypothetical protein
MRFSHGIIHHNDSAGEARLREKYRSDVPMLEFHSYAYLKRSMPPRTSTNEAIRLVFAGGVNPSRLPRHLFGTSQFLDLIPEITSQGLSLDILQPPYASSRRMRRDMTDYFRMARSDHRFIFRFGVGTDQLPAVLNGYNYGFLPYFRTGLTVEEDQYRYNMPAKFFTYLEAGLPMVCSDEFRYPARMVEELNIGTIVARPSLNRLSSMLDREADPDLLKNVERAQKRFSMEAHLPRLTAFYDLIVNEGSG